MVAFRVRKIYANVTIMGQSFRNQQDMSDLFQLISKCNGKCFDTVQVIPKYKEDAVEMKENITNNRNTF